MQSIGSPADKGLLAPAGILCWRCQQPTAACQSLLALSVNESETETRHHRLLENSCLDATRLSRSTWTDMNKTVIRRSTELSYRGHQTFSNVQQCSCDDHRWYYIQISLAGNIPLEKLNSLLNFWDWRSSKPPADISPNIVPPNSVTRYDTAWSQSWTQIFEETDVLTAVHVDM